jgi:hypothetical protein
MSIPDRLPRGSENVYGKLWTNLMNMVELDENALSLET